MRAALMGGFQKGTSIMNAQSPNLSQPMFETWAAADGTVITIRSVSPADLPLETEFVNGVSASTGYQRLILSRRPSPEELRRFTNIDPERELALIASTIVQDKERQMGKFEARAGIEQTYKDLQSFG